MSGMVVEGIDTHLRIEFGTSKIHSLELTWKWRMAPWKTIFHDKQAVAFH